MEHRHFQRKPVDMVVQLFTIEGKAYQAHLLDLSEIGMRVVVNETLPERIKLVDVLLPDFDQRLDLTYRMQMFVARKEGRVLGLCLLNERARIDVDRHRQCDPACLSA